MHYLVLDMVEYLVESAAYEPESVCTTIRGGSEFVARVYEGLHACMGKGACAPVLSPH